ncbi:G protein-coupled glucose receptor regulating Gpa2-domain-containing protein [Astrocystis sublimbata]|nr:G protein-coupled glucose receptor regulating Gpa2-domain-containing protein [Astrocystis sublimbata]
MSPSRHLLAGGATDLMSTTYDRATMKRAFTHNVDPADSDMLAEMWVSFSFSAISVASALFAFYWFIRMRRGFRQEMIMLLIQSDMAKTLWLLINPMFYFITGKSFGSSHLFCQVSGFFLAVTVEASDIAVLLIAIHTALFVVKHQYPGVAAFGLQPYRRIAYTLWAVVPFVLAAIVPISGASFADNGPYCYLPIRPEWYHNALTWIPRYIILSFIIVTYAWLYLWVYVRFRRFAEDQRRASTLSAQSADSSTRLRAKRKWRSHSVPTTPSLATHHLLDSPLPGTSKADSLKLRQCSVASTVSTLQIGEGPSLPPTAEAQPRPLAARRPSIAWNIVEFGHDGSGTPNVPMSANVEIGSLSPRTRAAAVPSSSFSRADGNLNYNIPTTESDETTIQEPRPTYHSISKNPSSHNLYNAQRSRWKRRFTETGSYPDTRRPRNSIANLIKALRQGPPRAPRGSSAEEEFDAGSAPPSPSVHLTTEGSEDLMRQSRERMRRQLRLLFVYPAIYTLTWIAPFVAHVSQYYVVYPVPHVLASSSSSGYNSNSTVSEVLGAWASLAGSHQSKQEPLALRIISTASLCIGTAVDCGFFSAWERPWKHQRGGFWENLALRLRLSRFFGGARENGPGRNRDERVADARAATTRRARERERESGTTAAGGSAADGGGGTVPTTGGRSSQTGRRREWWDALEEEAGL